MQRQEQRQHKRRVGIEPRKIDKESEHCQRDAMLIVLKEQQPRYRPRIGQCRLVKRHHLPLVHERQNPPQRYNNRRLITDERDHRRDDGKRQPSGQPSRSLQTPGRICSCISDRDTTMIGPQRPHALLLPRKQQGALQAAPTASNSGVARGGIRLERGEPHCVPATRPGQKRIRRNDQQPEP
jgi:hypothetical protein